MTPKDVLAAGGGAADVRALVPPSSPELEGLLQEYSNSVARVFYLLVSILATGFASSWGMGWKYIRKKKNTQREDI